MDLKIILQDYIEKIIPQMVNQGYHLTLVKGGKDYPHLPEQSHFAHIINGIFGLSRLLNYLQERNIYNIDEQEYRRVLSLYTTHDLHKTEEKMGGSVFSIRLEDIREEKQVLGLDHFAQTSLEEHRAANVHFRSKHKGDFPNFVDLRTWTMVRIADSMASMTRAGDVGALRTIENYFSDLCSELPLNYTLYYHELNDVRGVLTNLIHTLVSKTLQQELNLFPLLFFTTGVVYLGPKNLGDFDQSQYISVLSKKLLAESLASIKAKDQATEGLRRKEYGFQKYVYLFADIETLLEVAYEYAINAKFDNKFPESITKEFFGKKQTVFADVREFTEKLDLSLEEPKEFNKLWFTVNRYLLLVDSLVRDLIGNKQRLSWFIEMFDIPLEIREPLKVASPIFVRGKGGKYVAIIGYHFLKGADFKERAAIQYPPEQVFEILTHKIVMGFQKYDLSKAKQQISQELGIEEDLQTYLKENLRFSWQQQSQLLDDAFATYITPKKKRTSRICALCSRDSKAFKHDEDKGMREGILGDFVQGFSNRNLPVKVQGSNMCWCPTCYLEFMLRSMARLASPSDADKKSSKRLYLYVLPTYFFTPEHTLWLAKILKPFRELTCVQVRDYGKDAPGHPRVWLENRKFEKELVEKFMGVFEREAERLEHYRQEKGKEPVGDRLLTTPLNQTNYLMFVWEKAEYKGLDKKLIPTRSEMWAKAIFAATMIAGLTSCKVVVTERPYLPIVEPAALKPTIVLDAPHNILRGILPDHSRTISLPDITKLLDLCAAIWYINSDVSRKNRDNQVSKRLELLSAEPLAGACFYKEFFRENKDKMPKDLYVSACRILLEYLGGEKMILAKQLAEKSMELYLPYRRSLKEQRGKARTYELIFREAADEFKAVYKQVVSGHAGQSVAPELLEEVKILVSGRLQKRLEKRQESKRGDGKVNPWRKDLKVMVQEFVALVVDQLFLGRSHGSFTEFHQMVNSMADGIFFETDMNINSKWAQYTERVEEWKKANAV